MELDLQKSLFGLHVRPMHIAHETQHPPPPAFGLIYEGAIGHPRYTTSLCDPLYAMIKITWQYLLNFGVDGDQLRISVAKFIVSEWGNSWLRHRLVVPAWQPMQTGGPVRQPYAGVNFIPPVRDYEFGYWFVLAGKSKGKSGAIVTLAPRLSHRVSENIKQYLFPLFSC